MTGFIGRQLTARIVEGDALRGFIHRQTDHDLLRTVGGINCSDGAGGAVDSGVQARYINAVCDCGLFVGGNSSVVWSRA